MAVALTVAEQEALVGDLDFGDKGFLPIDDLGVPAGLASKEQQSEPSMAVMRCGEGEPAVLTTPTGAPIMSEGNAPFHANVYEFDGGDAPEPEEVTVTSVTPNSVMVGSPDTPITVAGTGFTAASVISASGTSIPTVFGDATSLTGTVPAASLAAAGSIDISVDGSATVPLTISAAGTQTRRR